MTFMTGPSFTSLVVVGGKNLDPLIQERKTQEQSNATKKA